MLELQHYEKEQIIDCVWETIKEYADHGEYLMITGRMRLLRLVRKGQIPRNDIPQLIHILYEHNCNIFIRKRIVEFCKTKMCNSGRCFGCPPLYNRFC